MQSNELTSPAPTTMNWLPSRRLTNFLGVIACAGMLGVGYFFQYVVGLEPCPMCILARIAIFCSGCVFLLAALHNPQQWGAKVWGVLLGLVIGTGAAVAARHVYLQNFLPEDAELACGMGLDYIMDTFSPGEALTMILQGTGDCTEIVWSFLGLSIPAWTFVALVGLAIIGVGRNWMRA